MQPPSAPCWYIYLSCALISHPDLLSHLNSYLSLPAAEGNKILLLWKRLTERREDFQCADRSLYKAISCLCAERWLQPFYEHCVSLFFVEKLQGRWSERQTKDPRKKVKRGKDLWSLAWLILIIGSASNFLVIVRPMQHLLHSNTTTIQSSTSPLFCSGDESRH